MSYRFLIQASCPRFVAQLDAEDASLSDAIQTISVLDTEYAVLVWNWVYVPLSYKYDLSLMVDDVLGLLEVMISEPHGSRRIQWPSNTFFATWDVEWDGESATVQAEWICVLGDTQAMLANKPKIVVPRTDFIEEWRRPLMVIAAALEAAGYDGANLSGMKRLEDVLRKIARCGILYRE